MKGLKNQIMKKTSLFICTLLFISSIVFYPKISYAYTFWAQQNYESPREATGKIVCANCHLAQMPTIAEVPQSVGADSVFKAVVKIPYKNDLKEIGADGSEVPLQVGAVVMLPDGFKLAPQERWTEEIKKETEGVYFTNYSEDKDNIIIVGPLPGDTNKEIVFPVLSPDPSTNKEYHYGKYSLHIGGNRGRGQVYPTGDKSNNVVFTSSTAGTINSIETIEDGSYQVNIEKDNGEITTIEGISENSTYDDLREAFKKYHALQCGYCTPGFLTTIVYLLEKKQYLSDEEIRKKLSGNICRCTGYTGIIKAVKEVMANRFKRSIND